MNKGVVIKNTGSWYLVRKQDGGDIYCKLKGNFRIKGIRSTNPLAVGDKVYYDVIDDETALITKIEPRENYIIRKSPNLSKESHILAANIDLCFLIVTVTQPETSTTFIDRFLAAAEAYRIPVCLVINKIDVYDEDDIRYAHNLSKLYQYIGYQSVLVSSVTGEGIDDLKMLINNKVTLFSGHSGVGKSTLINHLIPDLALRTGNISEAHAKGMHTTTFSEMIDIPSGGFLIDTPGIKGFGMIDMEKGLISHYFKEIFEISADCKFNNCMHINEPHCAVLDALEKHQISQSRYQSYISILNDDIDEKYRAKL